MMQITKSYLKGGEFLIKDTEPADIFIPEELNEEQQMMADTARGFLNAEVDHLHARLDAQEPGLMVKLLDKAGELGLLGISIPEEYGGLGKDFLTATRITEVLGAGHSFSVAMAAHSGIGTLPILYFGTKEQKEKYLPLLTNGKWKASYCLTEPGSGSDALAAKTKATVSEDGKYYILNGQKMWITNAGFADMFIVFAQIDGDKFTGFIVERTYPGISFGEEEHKMGIKGSSTRQVFFTDCKVPVENVLGDIGKGHLIAFNILNIGRAKLAAAALGAAKKVCSLSISYANQREQFKLPISKFGAIRHKLAEQAIKIFVAESAVYRTSQLIDEKEKEMMEAGLDISKAILKAAEEYAVECAILKIALSETLDFVVDEGVQIYGGYGYSADFPMDRAYRDSRINRIFEGTNEINRLLIVDMILKRAMKGDLDVMAAAGKVQKELMSLPEMNAEKKELYAYEKSSLANMKKAMLMVAGAAVQKFKTTIAKEQEILMNIADMIIIIFITESALLRVQKLSGNNNQDSEYFTDILNVHLADSLEHFGTLGRTAINAFAEADEKRMMISGMKRFIKPGTLNTKEARRRIAKKLIDNNGYSL